MATYADIINKRKRDWNCEDLMEGAHKARSKKLPFSSPLMNWCTYGGIPREAITEFFGDPGGGKTTTSVDICKNAIEVFQKEYEDKAEALRDSISHGSKVAPSQLADLEDMGPKKVLYIDLEHSFDAQWSKTLGIDESAMDIMQPPDVIAEDILNTILDIIQTGEVGLIVLDSIPSLVPKQELDKNIGERTVANLAGILTVFCRKVVPMLTRYGTTLIFINQVRDNLENPYVVKTPGGRAPKFFASLRIVFRIGSPVDFLGNELPVKTENPAGYIVNAQIVKQKSAPWDRKQGTYFLMCKSGIRPDFDYAKLAVNRYGIINKSGAWFTLCDPDTGEVLTRPDPATKNGVVPLKVNGMAKVYDYFQANPEYYEKVKRFILDDINGSNEEE